ncbi:hypothetical protein ACFPIJ_29570 [Dactylosporangium cerinum]|uniref:Uncharacterized protein n=1 Tax=Dactylosporangium cerinum TaxID=1434730 RepID=A0ABV9W2A9_9ACTN
MQDAACKRTDGERRGPGEVEQAGDGALVGCLDRQGGAGEQSGEDEADDRADGEQRRDRRVRALPDGDLGSNESDADDDEEQAGVPGGSVGGDVEEVMAAAIRGWIGQGERHRRRQCEGDGPDDPDRGEDVGDAVEDADGGSVEQPEAGGDAEQGHPGGSLPRGGAVGHGGLSSRPAGGGGEEFTDGPGRQERGEQHGAGQRAGEAEVGDGRSDLDDQLTNH